jgi:hypothetical protein
MLLASIGDDAFNRWRAMTTSQHVYKIRPRKDRRGVDLVSDALPFDRLWYGEPNAVSNAWTTLNSTAAHMML